jgi:hypothetical protein
MKIFSPFPPLPPRRERERYRNRVVVYPSRLTDLIIVNDRYRLYRKGGEGKGGLA